MFAISDRVSPCSARCSPRSVGRLTTTSPSFFSILSSRETRSSSVPRGPFTRTTSGSIVTSTVEGTGIGCFPMRLMIRLPNVRDDLAADALAPRVVAGHYSPGGGDDRRAHAAEDLRDLVRLH